MIKKISFGFTAICLLLSNATFAAQVTSDARQPSNTSVTVNNTSSNPVPVAVQGTPQPYQVAKFFTVDQATSKGAVVNFSFPTDKTFLVKSVVASTRGFSAKCFFGLRTQNATPYLYLGTLDATNSYEAIATSVVNINGGIPAERVDDLAGGAINFTCDSLIAGEINILVSGDLY